MRTKRAAEQEIIRLLKAIKLAEGERRTLLLRDLAEAILDLREHFTTAEGKPDWIGRTGTYRLAVRDLFSDAGYSRDDARLVQSSLHYHTGNALRNRIGQHELVDLGVAPTTPQERARDTRREQLRQLKLWREAQENAAQ